MVHSDKWFLQSTCPTDKFIQFEISKPESNEFQDVCEVVAILFQPLYHTLFFFVSVRQLWGRGPVLLLLEHELL